MSPKEIRTAARFMDKQFKEQKESEKKYEERVASENEKLEDLVAQVKNAIENGTIQGTLLLRKIIQVTGCTPDIAIKIQEIIRGGK